jgi:hypothetical protein
MADMDGGMIQALMAASQGYKQSALGAIQTAIGFFGGRKAKKALESQQTPIYTPSKSISDYYNQALQRYQESPEQSNLYKMQAQSIARGTNQGLSTLQQQPGNRMLGGVSALIQNQNDASLKALAAAEQQKDQRFGQLGSASQAMGAEERQAFNINKMLPYQNRRDILQQKAGGYAQMLNSGITNLFGGGQTNSIAAGGLSSMSGRGNPNYGNDYASHEAIPSVQPMAFNQSLASY